MKRKPSCWCCRMPRAFPQVLVLPAVSESCPVLEWNLDQINRPPSQFLRLQGESEWVSRPLRSTQESLHCGRCGVRNDVRVERSNPKRLNECVEECWRNVERRCWINAGNRTSLFGLYLCRMACTSYLISYIISLLLGSNNPTWWDPDENRLTHVSW